MRLRTQLKEQYKTAAFGSLLTEDERLALLEEESVFASPYPSLSAAIEAATKFVASTNEPVNIVQSFGLGFEVVEMAFILDRQYYHNPEGRKQFFEFIQTVNPL